MVTGVSLREDTLRSWDCVSAVADALQLLMLPWMAGWFA